MEVKKLYECGCQSCEMLIIEKGFKPVTWPCECEHCATDRLRRGIKNGLLITLFMVLVLIASCAHASNTVGIKPDGYTLDQWANAIRHAEGNSNYGVLAHYKHTSYRQACINTVAHKYRLWAQSGHKGVFLAYLGASYAPIGASNDPTGLNRNWIRNVQYYLEQQKKG